METPLEEGTYIAKRVIWGSEPRRLPRQNTPTCGVVNIPTSPAHQPPDEWVAVNDALFSPGTPTCRVTSAVRERSKRGMQAET